ncbi:hypothetical protein D3C87_347830 [compost metagenome]
MSHPNIEHALRILSQATILELSQLRPFFDYALLPGRDPLTKLKGLVERSRPAEMDFIEKNIGCYAALTNKAKTTGVATQANLHNQFSFYTALLQRRDGPLTARDLVRLYRWMGDGELSRFKVMRAVISELANQFSERLGAVEIEKYGKQVAALSLMARHPAEGRHALLSHRGQLDMTMVAELNENLGFNATRICNEIPAKNQFYRHWIAACDDVLAVNAVLAGQPAITSLTLVSKMLAGEVFASGLKERLGDTWEQKIPSRSEMGRLVQVIEDPTLNQDVRRIARTSCDLITLMEQGPLSVSIARLVALSPQERQEQVTVFSSLPSTSLRQAFTLCGKGAMLENLLDRGMEPLVAVRRAGLDAIDMLALQSVFPVINQLNISIDVSQFSVGR